MNKKQHSKIHSLVPVYASLSRIQKLAVEGYQSGRADTFIDVRVEAEDGLAQLLMVEKEILDGKHKVSSNRVKGARRQPDTYSGGITGAVIDCTGEEVRGNIVRMS